MTQYALTEFGVLKVAGAEAKKFLQGQVTCHLDEVTETSARLCAHCNPQGRIISLFRILMKDQVYYLIMPHQMVSLTLAALKKYAVFFKTTLTDASAEWQVLGAENGAVVMSEQNHQGLLPFSAWKSGMLQKGVADIYPETSGMFLPHELNLPQLGAVSFDKGCYTGQEIIARMHYRGKLKQSLQYCYLTHATPLLPGKDFFTGCVVDVCRNDENHYHTLILSAEKLNEK